MEFQKETKEKEEVVKSDLQKADDLAARLEEQNRIYKEQNDRAEEIAVRNTLGGRSAAGEQALVISEEEKKKLGALDMFKGTEIERALKDANKN